MVRDLLMASIFGASAMTDAFNVAFRLPNMFRRLFGEGAFSQAFVPVLGATKGEQGEAATRLLIDRVATVLSAVLALTCIVGVRRGAGAGLGAWPAACSRIRAVSTLRCVMARWMFPYIGFMSLVALGAGILNTWKTLRRAGLHAGVAQPGHDRGDLARRALVRAHRHRADLCAGDRCHGRRRAATGPAGGGACAGSGLLPRVQWRWSAIRTRLGRPRNPAHRHADGAGAAGRWRGASVGHHQPADRLAPDAGQRELDELCRAPDGVSRPPCWAWRWASC